MVSRTLFPEIPEAADYELAKEDLEAVYEEPDKL